jgi:hypothetical protein
MKLWLSVFLLGTCVAHGNTFGLQGFIDARVAKGDTIITIPPGRYEVVPTERVHLRFENLSDLTIHAEGVEMVCTETTRAITIRNCTNLTIRGLTVDYDPLPFTQGQIVEISEDRKSHIIEIMDGFPPAESAMVFKHSIYTPDGELRFGNYFKYELEPLPGNRLRISGLHPSKDGGERVGDVVVVSAEYLSGRYLAHAIMLEKSVGAVLEDITLYSSPCFGFFETHCAGSVYRNCTVDRRAGRMHSLNADAFHSKFAKVGPQIIGCKAMWQGDDCVNICGAYHVVVKSTRDSLRVLAKQSLDIQQGDPVELVAANGQRLPDARVRSIKPAGTVMAEEAVRLKKLKLKPSTVGFLKNAYVIQLDRKMDLPFGSLICSLNRKGNGFSVEDCTFGNNRSRGILIKASDGEVRGNHIENCHGQAIKIAPELYWLESGYSRNLLIKGNTVINSGEEALLIEPIGKDGSGFENIRVSENCFSTHHNPPVSFPSVGVVFEDNTVDEVE